MGAFNELDWTAYPTAGLRDQQFCADLTCSSFSSDIGMALWTEPVQCNAQIQLDNSYINCPSHFGSTSSELSQSSLGSLLSVPNIVSDDISAYQSPVEPLIAGSLPFSMSTFQQILSETQQYRASAGPISSNSSVASAQEYSGLEYLTAKEKSLLHRRKQNRAAQRTFRQRKEQERAELQVRLNEVVKQAGDLQNTCEVLNAALKELRSKVGSLEGENIRLKEQHKQLDRQNPRKNEGEGSEGSEEKEE